MALTGETTAPLDDISQEVRSFLYPDQRPNMHQYLNVTRLRTYHGAGVLAATLAIENELLTSVERKAVEWARTKPSLRMVIAFEGEQARWAYESFKGALAGARFGESTEE
jgi:hypothetical protein